ncbi:MAG: flavin reductase [Candidatus Aminicenantes bacterium]|jgi:flavin reductase (DIM6/NTAB) family NADH-FMN oxidoreductase RutF
MTENFKLINPEAIIDNPFKIIGDDWMLITAGKAESHKTFNTMTASWGSLGILWNKPVSFCFVRPTRYTYGFMERNKQYTLSFFDKAYREALNVCGTLSGRDVDKVARAGLTSFEIQSNAVTFQEARLVLVCQKLYFQDLDPGHFLDPTLEKNYPQKDYHRLYIGEITAVYIRT